MIEYQNIFTQVQVRGPVEMGVDNENNMAAERGGTPWFSRFAGWIGNAQIGPVFLGWTGVIALHRSVVVCNCRPEHVSPSWLVHSRIPSSRFLVSAGSARSRMGTSYATT